MRSIAIIFAIAGSVFISACTNTNPASTASSNAVTAASTATAGTGQKVKGLNNIDGEIVGSPSANGKFKQLQIGMSMKQVTDIVGQPTDQGEYETGKRWIPFYFGDDTRRTELLYKGQGRLTFASGSVFGSNGGGVLIRVLHNANEAGYR